MMKLVTLMTVAMWATLSLADDLEISKSVIKLVPPASKNTAGYLTIKNNTDQDVKLLKVESDIAQVIELHTMMMENDMMVMRPVEFILIPKKGEVELKGGGLHVMFLGLKKPVVKGGKVEAKLIFNEGKTQRVHFVVND